MILPGPHRYFCVGKQRLRDRAARDVLPLD
jgi:hypothetical protein